MAFSAQIHNELEANINSFSQDGLVSQVELLPNHSHRFYNCQFITRKATNHDLSTALNKLLDECFDKIKAFSIAWPLFNMLVLSCMFQYVIRVTCSVC